MNNYMIPLLLVLAVIIFCVGFVHILEWWDRKKSDDKDHCKAANEDDYPVEIPNKDDLARELQERIVQVCLDFIREKGDKSIHRVAFSADSLQESARDGKWMPCTDSYIELDGLVWDPEIMTVVRKEIGRYM